MRTSVKPQRSHSGLDPESVKMPWPWEPEDDDFEDPPEIDRASGMTILS
jgi:hypothetical protein